MTPVEPRIGEDEERVVYANDQPEYLPLPASVDVDGVVTTEWEPSEFELERLLSGGRIQLRVHTFRQLLQPVSITVLEPDCGMRES